MFRPSSSSSGPARRQSQELFSFPALWDPKRMFVYYNTSGWKTLKKNEIYEYAWKMQMTRLKTNINNLAEFKFNPV